MNRGPAPRRGPSTRPRRDSRAIVREGAGNPARELQNLGRPR